MRSKHFFFFVNKYKSLYEYNTHSFLDFETFLRLTANKIWCTKVWKYLKNAWNSDGMNVPF